MKHLFYLSKRVNKLTSKLALSLVTCHLSLIFSLAFSACETAENISFGMDHETPSGMAVTDSLQVHPGQTVDIKIAVSDNAGLSKVVFSYGEWMIRESVSLAELNYPQSYTFETSIVIPEDAITAWEEDVILNDGSKKTIVQHYHQLLLEATDRNMNVKDIPVYIRVTSDK
ncbi:MAG: hypothetical protein LBP72_05125 [Dysgonamonadaceae bacterium]|jgi:hypothetical protein|nr:hypothetical protein [Dysgonamonadaceae bacterium]